MSKSKLDLLKELSKVAEKIKNMKPKSGYWEKEKKILDEMDKKNKKLSDSTVMTYEKFHQEFTI
jgi:hypothetical protein